MRRDIHGLLKRDIVIVLFFVGVLAAILGPNFYRARAGGSLTACKSNLKNIGTAFEMYSTDWSGHYPKDISRLTPNYLKTFPECPQAGKDTYSDSYELRDLRVDSLRCTLKGMKPSEACREKQKELEKKLKALPEPPVSIDAAFAGNESICPDGEPYEYRPFAKYYWICCQGSNHTAVAVPENFPQYDGVVGLIEHR